MEIKNYYIMSAISMSNEESNRNLELLANKQFT